MNKITNMNYMYKNNSSVSFCALLCAMGAVTGVDSAKAESFALEELIVTASRRDELLQDVPYNINAISGDDLTKTGVSSLNDLAQQVPGLQTVNTGPSTRGGNNNFSIRGLRFDAPGSDLETFRKGSVAAVSTYLGETAIFYPIMIKDIEQVEVLKGPQGTLYGSGSLSGTVRLMPKRPNIDAFEGHVEAEVSVTDESDEVNHAYNVVLNTPISDNFGIRLSAGKERLGGFVDAVNLIQRETSDPLSNPILSNPSDPRSGYALAPIKKDTNESDQRFARLSALWLISDSVDVEVSYMNQKTEVGDSQVSNPNYEGGTYSYDSTGISPNSAIQFRPGGKYKNTAERLASGESQLDLTSVTFNADLGAAYFTSSSSYYKVESDEIAPYTLATQLFNTGGDITLNYYDFWNNYPRANYTSTVSSEDKALTQEFRLVSSWDKDFDYLIGGYYQKQELSFSALTYEPGYAAYAEALGTYDSLRPQGDLRQALPRDRTEFEDKAIFTELTAYITPDWQVTAGIRYFWQTFDVSSLALNYHYDGAGTIDYDVERQNKVKDHIVKLNSSYHINSDAMIYGTYSEGFRRGGANSVPISGEFASLPSLTEFTPDRSENYELGLKSTFVDGRLHFNAALFYITVEDYQFSGHSGSGYPIVLNGDEARSQGVELESTFGLTPRATISASYTYLEAKTQSDFQVEDLAYAALLTNPTSPEIIPIVTASADTRLPTSPRHSVNVAVDYVLPINDSEINLHLDVAYRSGAPGYVDKASDRYWDIPSYVLANARAQYTPSPDANWSVSLFVNNLTNDTAYSGGFGAQTFSSPWAGRYTARPRTVGLSAKYNF